MNFPRSSDFFDSSNSSKAQKPPRFDAAATENESVDKSKTNDDSIYSTTPTAADGRNSRRYHSVRCAVCGTSLAVGENELGRTLICPDCGTRISVPRNLEYVESDYEQFFYNSEKTRRNELYSPIRNPNRENIDFAKENVYSVDATSGERSENVRKTFQYRVVRCPLCQTEIAVLKNERGKSLVCPDCATKFVVPNNIDFSETEFERVRFDDERKRRDRLYSPVRNPNREGIDVVAANVYSLDAPSVASANSVNSNKKTAQNGVEKSNGKTSGKKDDSGDFIPVRCRVCETLMQAPRELLGKTIRCSDCGAETLVSSAFEEQQKGVDVRFDPRDRGVYEIGEIPIAPGVFYRSENGKSVEVKPGVRTVAPAPTLKKTFEKTKNNDEKSQNEKKIKRPRRREESRAGRPDPSDGSAPLVLRRRGDAFVWALASPPKKFPLFNDVFAALATYEIWTRAFVVAILSSAISASFATIFLPFAKRCSEEAFAHSAFEEFGVLAAAAIVFPLALVCWSICANSFASIFSASSTGARRVVDWREDDLLGNVAFVGWFFLVVSVSFWGGFIVAAALDWRSAAPLSDSGTAVAAEISTEIGQTGQNDGTGETFNAKWGKPLAFASSFWLFFPIFFLSTSRSDWFFAPLTGSVFGSFFSRFGVWFQFYFATALLVGAPLASFWRFAETTAIWFLIPPAFVLGPILYSLLLGRLAWIIDDSVRANEYDD